MSRISPRGISRQPKRSVASSSTSSNNPDRGSMLSRARGLAQVLGGAWAGGHCGARRRGRRIRFGASALPAWERAPRRGPETVQERSAPFNWKASETLLSARSPRTSRRGNFFPLLAAVRGSGVGYLPQQLPPAALWSSLRPPRDSRIAASSNTAKRPSTSPDTVAASRKRPSPTALGMDFNQLCSRQGLRDRASATPINTQDRSSCVLPR